MKGMENRVILVLTILTVIFFMSTVGSCSNAHRLKLTRDKEMATRLDLEEKMNKFIQEKTTWENKLDSLTQELEKEQAAHEATKTNLAQEQLVTQSLKEELQKLTQLKETLEDDLKDALIKGKSETKR